MRRVRNTVIRTTLRAMYPANESAGMSMPEMFSSFSSLFILSLEEDPPGVLENRVVGHKHHL